MSIPRPGYATDGWSAMEWRAAYERAAAYLATDPKWVVGPAVVAMYRVGWQRARAGEQASANVD